MSFIKIDIRKSLNESIDIPNDYIDFNTLESNANYFITSTQINHIQTTHKPNITNNCLLNVSQHGNYKLQMIIDLESSNLSQYMRVYDGNWSNWIKIFNEYNKDDQIYIGNTEPYINSSYQLWFNPSEDGEILEIVDSLDVQENTNTKALSAHQGYILNQKINNILDFDDESF